MPTSYETGGPDPGRRPLGPVRAIALPAILLVAGSMVTACGGDDPGSASDAPAASATFHMSAADREMLNGCGRPHCGRSVPPGCGTWRRL